ncbi:UNVERIFIED_ORG: hypothetical protein GGI57_000429 [Rhizobium aethiopicum]
MYNYYLTSPGERPLSTALARHLWGSECDFDADGNDDEALVGGWTELTVALRPECRQRVDIDPVDGSQPLVLVIRSESAELAKKAALFLQSHSGGILSDQPPR